MSQQPQGKYYVSSYTNINGQEQRIEKEFDSKDDYESFMKEHNIKVPSFQFSFPSFFSSRSFLPQFGRQDGSIDQVNHSLPLHSQDLVELKRKKVERERRKAQLDVLIKDAQELADYFDKEGDKESAKKAKDIVKKYKDEMDI